MPRWTDVSHLYEGRDDDGSPQMYLSPNGGRTFFLVTREPADDSSYLAVEDPHVAYKYREGAEHPWTLEFRPPG